jgi:hypothetical protein
MTLSLKLISGSRVRCPEQILRCTRRDPEEQTPVFKSHSASHNGWFQQFSAIPSLHGIVKCTAIRFIEFSSVVTRQNRWKPISIGNCRRVSSSIRVSLIAQQWRVTQQSCTGSRERPCVSGSMIPVLRVHCIPQARRGQSQPWQGFDSIPALIFLELALKGGANSG